jgi:hypothetical protein
MVSTQAGIQASTRTGTRTRSRFLIPALWAALALLLGLEAYLALIACGVSIFGLQTRNCPAPATERAAPTADFDDLLRRIREAEARLAEGPACPAGDLAPLQIPPQLRDPPPDNPPPGVRQGAASPALTCTGESATGLRDGCDTTESPLWPLLLLLPLLFLFLYWLKRLLYWLKKPIAIFGTQVKTTNIIVLIDVSGSMTGVLNEVRDESARILSAMTANNTTYHVNYIAFATTEEPLFSQLTKIDTKTRDTIMDWLGRGGYSAGGGNEYQAGFKTAFAQSLESGRPTTIVLLTDGDIPLVKGITPGKTQEQQLSSILSPFPENLAARTKTAALKRRIIIKVPKIYTHDPLITSKMKALVEAFNGRAW